MASLEQKSTPNKDKLGIKPVKIKYSGNSNDAARKKVDAVKNTPTVYYYGVELPSQYVKSIVIDCNKFLPLAYVCFKDVYNMLHDVGFPGDNAKLTIVFPSNDDKLGPIFMDFKITKYEVEQIRETNARKIHFWGTCNVERLLIQDTVAYKGKSSYDVLKTIAGEAGLGFSSNVAGTKDLQTWACMSQDVHEFVQDTVKSAWNGESGFMWAFVDQYYNLNYLDVELALSQNINDISWFSTTIVNRAGKTNTEPDTKATKPVLTNEANMRNTNLYFTGEKILNQSTDISLKRGYIRNVSFYDKDGNWESKAGKYKLYALDTITSTGNSAPHVILKGEPGDTKFYDMNSGTYYMGVIDTANAHTDYLWARMQNSENIKDLQKVCMQVILPQPNYNVRRFEKVKLLFVNNTAAQTGQQTNVKLNGEWLVVGITFEWNNSTMFQKLNLVKREITLNDL